MGLDERYYNERDIMEYALKALMNLKAEMLLVDKAIVLKVNAHKAVLPEDLKFLLMVAYYDNGMYLPLQINSSPFFNDKCNNDLKICSGCRHTFAIDDNLIMTTTLADGEIYVAYRSYPCDEEGNITIPDSEDLKEAIYNFILYKYWQKKYNMMEEGSDSRMRFYLDMWNTLSTKAVGNLNMPSLSTMEKIKNQHNSLMPRSRSFDNLFTSLGSSSHANF
jgi:hypothetical protein